MIHEFLAETVYLGVILTLGSYAIGLWLKKKTKLALINPLLIGIILTILVLWLTDTPYDNYTHGTQVINYLLTPATICLAVPLYEQIQHLKNNFHAISLGIISGVLSSMLSILAMVLILDLDHTSYVTLLPKSITTAIGMGVSEELGGNVPVTIMVIVFTGIIGNIFAERFLRLIGIINPVAKGIAIGSASHVIGTTKAMEIGQTEGAMSSLSIVTSGIITVIVASIFAHLA